MFEGKTAVITGAGSGIGRGLAQQLAVAGARLALSDVNASGLEETMLGIMFDLPSRSDVEECIITAGTVKEKQPPEYVPRRPPARKAQ